jgi:hypothetical protein
VTKEKGFIKLPPGVAIVNTFFFVAIQTQWSVQQTYYDQKLMPPELSVSDAAIWSFTLGM